MTLVFLVGGPSPDHPELAERTMQVRQDVAKALVRASAHVTLDGVRPIPVQVAVEMCVVVSSQ